VRRKPASNVAGFAITLACSGDGEGESQGVDGGHQTAPQKSVVGDSGSNPNEIISEFHGGYRSFLPVKVQWQLGVVSSIFGHFNLSGGVSPRPSFEEEGAFLRCLGIGVYNDGSRG